MRLAERIYLVGSGSFGFDLTDPYDCHVYLLDGGTELALIDVGAGMGAEAIVENVRRDGFDPGRGRLDAQIRTVRRLRELEVKALLPGHLALSLENGQRHIKRANEVLDRLLIPEQMASAW